MSHYQHLLGLAAKIAARHLKRANRKPGSGPGNGLVFKVPASHTLGTLPRPESKAVRTR